MVVEEIKIGNAKVTIHDDYIVSDKRKVDAILHQIGVLISLQSNETKTRMKNKSR